MHEPAEPIIKPPDDKKGKKSATGKGGKEQDPALGEGRRGGGPERGARSRGEAEATVVLHCRLPNVPCLGSRWSQSRVCFPPLTASPKLHRSLAPPLQIAPGFISPPLPPCRSPQASSLPRSPPADRPKPQLYPNALGVDRPRLRLKQGGSDKLRGFFLPFTMGTHHCTVIFRDKDLGQFVYELVAEAGLPAPMLQAKGVVPLEGPYVYSLFVPWLNSNLEAAKRTFADRHPLAKDKAQAAYLKGEAGKTGERGGVTAVDACLDLKLG